MDVCHKRVVHTLSQFFLFLPVELANRLREPSGDKSKCVADSLVVCLVLHNNTIYHKN
jgi:hypothetical protein